MMQLSQQPDDAFDRRIQAARTLLRRLEQTIDGAYQADLLDVLLHKVRAQRHRLCQSLPARDC